MPLSADSLNEALLKFTLRTQFRYKQGVDRIRWEHEVLRPTVEKMKLDKGVLGLPDGVAFEIVVEDASPAPSQTTDASGSDTGAALPDSGANPSKAGA